MASTLTESSIEVRERSTRAVSESVYRRLEASQAALTLVDAGVLSLVRSRSVPFGVRAAAFVGQVGLGPGQVLVVGEKVEGTFQALLKYALPVDMRVSQAPGYVAQDGPALEVFAARFVETLGTTLGRGRIKQYEHQTQESSNPRGRIDLQRTAGLRAQGVTSRIVSRSPRLTAENAINQVFALSLHAVERVVTQDELRVRARRLGSLFEDVPVHALSRATYGIRRELCDRAGRDYRAVDEVQRALQYGRTLVLHLGYSLDDWSFETPEAHFINLETLFEEAVRTCLRENWATDVVQGSVMNTPLFAGRPGQYVVDPDIVVLNEQGGARLVGDVKYKDLAGLPDHADVYQLAAHSHAIGVQRAFLVYPGTQHVTTRLGTTSTGTEVWWTTVRPAHLPEDLLAAMGAILGHVPTGAGE